MKTGSRQPTHLVCYSTPVLSGHRRERGEHEQDWHFCAANLLSECIPRVMVAKMGNFCSSVLHGLISSHPLPLNKNFCVILHPNSPLKPRGGGQWHNRWGAECPPDFPLGNFWRLIAKNKENKRTMLGKMEKGQKKIRKKGKNYKGKEENEKCKGKMA